jgi:hypothetical protein
MILQTRSVMSTSAATKARITPKTEPTPMAPRFPSKALPPLACTAHHPHRRPILHSPPRPRGGVPTRIQSRDRGINPPRRSNDRGHRRPADTKTPKLPPPQAWTRFTGKLAPVPVLTTRPHLMPVPASTRDMLIHTNRHTNQHFHLVSHRLLAQANRTAKVRLTPASFMVLRPLTGG